jgi:hypothetical protein
MTYDQLQYNSIDHVSTPNPKLDLSYEVNHEEVFWVSDMEISKTFQKLHFEVTN